MVCFFRTYIVPAVPLLAALMVYLLGRSAYFRQKEFELITRRYLEEGLDAISRNVDKSLATFRHNWWQSTVLLKHFRDLGKDIPKNLYESAFVAPEPSLFEMWRDYRLVDLVGDQIFNHAHQSLDAFVRSSYAFFQYDLGSMVRVTVEGGKELEVNASREEMVASYITEIERLDKEARRFYVLLGELQALSSLLQSERFTFGTLPKLRNRETIRRAVETLKTHFGERAVAADNVVGPDPNNALKSDAHKGARLQRER